MSGRLRDKVALVTGAGLHGDGWSNGKACAVTYAREGARVMVVDLDGDAAEATAALIREEGGEAEALRGDVSDGDAVARMTRRCKQRFGALHVLHNNVGVLSAGGPVELDPADWQRSLDVNQTSMFLTCKHAIPLMLSQGGGAIVNVSSVAGFRWIGVPHVAYATTKGAVVSFTRAVALEYAARGIRANCVVPGLLDTPMIRRPMQRLDAQTAGALIANRHAASPTGAMGDAFDVAWASVYLASDEARYVTGTEIVVDGGLSQSCMSAPALPAG